MLFQEKFNRARAWQREQMPEDPQEEFSENLKEEQPDLSQEMEKGDLFAMLVSGFMVIWPICLLVLLLMCGSGWLFLHLFK